MSLKFDAEVGLNAAGFHRGMEGISSSLKNYALGAVGVYSIDRAFEKTIETVKELVNESKRMGVTVEQLQVFRKAAEESGVEIGVLAGAMEKLNVAREKALGGGAGAGKAMSSFAALGVTPAMLSSSSAQDIIFGAIRDKIKSVNPQDIAAPLRDILGKGFGPLIPLISTDMKELQDRMQKFGMIMSGETAHKLKEIDDALHSVTNVLVNALAPALVAFAEFILDTFTGTGFLGKAVEGLIFVLQKAGILSDKSGYAGHSASERAGVAQGIIDKMSEDRNVNDATAFQHKMGAMGKDGIFGDFKGHTGTDFFHFLQKLIEADTDATVAASKTSDATMAALRQAVDQFKAGLKNPPPPNPNPGNGDPGDPADTKSGPSIRNEGFQGDALIKVGNFLGSSRGTINNAQGRLEQHAATTARNTHTMIDRLDELIRRNQPPMGGDDWIT
jgi:hypothetical protein